MPRTTRRVRPSPSGLPTTGLPRIDRDSDRLARAARAAVERLEGRVLLAADLVYDRSASLTPFNARLTRTATAIQVVDAGNGTVLATQPLATFSGNVTIRGSADNDGLTFDPSLATAPLRTVSVDGGLGFDTVVFGGNFSTNGGSVTVTAEAITLSAGATVDTTAAAGAGAITLTGKTVAAAAGARLLAGGPSAGDVTVTVDDSPTVGVSVAGDTLSPVLVDDRSATIAFTGGTIAGNDVTVTATAATKTRFGDVGDYLDDISEQFLQTIGQVTDLVIAKVLPVSGQVKIEHATGTVVLTDTVVTAAGTADVEASADADASFSTLGVNNEIPIQAGTTKTLPFVASIGYGQTNATADVELNGSTTVTAGGDVTVATSTSSAGQTSSAAVGNGRASSSTSVQVAVSLAIALTSETSTVSTGPATRVQSLAGNVNINAAGDSDTETGGDAQVFQDGVGGLAVGVGVDQATVTATVNGTVIAANPQGTAGYTFTSAQVNVANDTVTLAGIDPAAPLARGDQLTYAAGTAPVGGLTDGQAYTVADVATVAAADGTLTQTVHLARAATLDLDASQVTPTSTQTLGRVTLSTFSSTAVGQDASKNLTVSNAALTVPLTTGQVVTYVGPSSPITVQNVAGTFARNGSGDTVTRTDGGTGWGALGLQAGLQVQITNATGSSNGTFTVKSISGDGKTLTFTQANVVTAGPASSFTLTTVPALIGNLTQGTRYTVVVTNGQVEFRDPTNSAALVKYASAGSGLQGFSLLTDVQSFRPATAVDAAAATIAIPNHGYRTGDLLVYHTDPTHRLQRNVYSFTAGSSTATLVGTADLPDPPVDGLRNGLAYYVTVVDANHVRLSESAVAAADAAVIDLTSAGTGTQTFAAPDATTGVSITATLDATNSAAAGVELSDAEQPASDVVLNATTSGANLAAGLARAPDLLASLREAVQTKLGATPAYGPQPQPAQDTGIPLDLSGTFAINAYQHTVLATLGPTAVVKSGHDLDVEATVTESTAVSSISEATRNGQDSADASNTGDARADVEISVAFAYGSNRNTARAVVSPGAVTDAARATTVNAAVDYPLRSDTPEAAINPAESLKGDGLDGLSVLLGGDLGLGDNLYNGLVTTLAGDPGSADADKAVVGLGLDLQFFTNEATARIGGGALVNQDPAYQTATQAVSVTATNAATLVDVAGDTALNLSVPGGLDALQEGISEGGVKGLQSIVNPLGLSGRNVIGPAVIVTITGNTTTAEVAAGAAVHTGPAGAGLTVDAEQDTFSLALAQTGARASEFGITASVTVDARTDVTTADIATGATITGGPVAVTAVDTTDRYGIDGGFVLGQKVGVGASVGVNDLSRTTTAYVGADTPDADNSPASAPPIITSAGAVTVDAEDHGNTFALVLAGSVLTEPTNTATPKQPTVPTNTGNAVGGGGVSTATGGNTGGSYTIAVGASVAVNEGTDTTRAFIDDPAVVAAAVAVTAESDPTVRAVVVGGAISTTKGGANGAGGTNIGIGGAVAVNDLSGTVAAFIRDADVRATQALAATPAVIVTATDAPKLSSDGGGVAVVVSTGAKAPTNVSVGVGVAVNDIATAAAAFVDASTVSAANGDVDVTATFTPTITAVTLGGAGAVSASASGSSINIAAAGAGAGNYVANGGAQAYVVDSPGVTVANGNLNLTATDTAAITVDAGGYALSASLSAGGSFTNLSVAASVAINQITDVTSAYVLNSPVSVTGGGVTVAATSAATINARTIGGALGSAGLAGAGSGNVINDTVSAYAQGGPNTAAKPVGLQATGPLSVTATNTPAITADAGGFGIALNLSTKSGQTTATASVGVGVAINNVTANTTAAVRDLTANANGASVVATSGSTINALTIAGAVSAALSQGPAFGFAGAGAGSGNTVVANATATIADANPADGATAVSSTGGPVAVRATDTSTVTANAGAVAIAAGISTGGKANVNVSVGASAAVNSLTPTVTASVDHAAVRGNGPLTVAATSTPTIQALTIAGAAAAAISPAGNGFGVAVAGAGAGSGNKIASNTVAKITNASTVTAQGSPTANAVSATAVDTAAITARAIGGSFALQTTSGGSVAIGVAIAKNDLSTGSVLAVVDGGSAVNATGNVAITATSTPSINALTVGAAVSVSVNSAGGVSLAGSGAGAQSTNTIARTVEARVVGGAAVSAVGRANLTVRAVDTSTITSASAGGSLALSASPSGLSGALAVSAGLSTDDVGNTVRAYVSGANTTAAADGAIDISTLETPTVNATAVSVSGAIAVTDPTSGFALALAGGAAQANNTLHNTVAAFVDAGASVTAATGLGVHADDAATVTATVPAIAFVISLGAGLSIGVTLSNNTVTDLVDAYANNATLRCTGGNVVVDAGSNDAVTANCTAVSVSISLGFAGQGGQATTTIAGHTNANLGTNAVVTASGEVDVTATTAATTTANNGGGGFGIFYVGVVLADSSVTESTAATVGTATVNAGSLKVATYGVAAGDPATSARTATARTVAGSVSVLGGQGQVANATVSGPVTAAIATGANVVVTGAVTVDANATSTAVANSPGGSGGGITVAALLANATNSAATTAQIAAAANVRAASLNVLATVNKTTTATILGANVSVIGGVGGKATAVDSAQTLATVGAAPSATPDVVVTGAATVAATSAEMTTASATGGAGGILNVAAFVADARSTGSTTASLAANASVSAGSLTVRAAIPTRTVSATQATAAAVVSGIGALGIRGDATVTGDAVALVGPGSRVVTPTTGFVTVDSSSNTTATSQAQGGSGGVVNVSVFEAKAQVGTTADRAVTSATLGDGSTVSTGALTVTAGGTSAATANQLSVSVGAALGVATSTAEADTYADTIAALGQGNATTVNAAGDVTVAARGNQSASDTLTAGAGGLVLGVGTAYANSTVGGNTTAAVGDRAAVNAGGAVNVSAITASATAGTNLTTGAGGAIAVAVTTATATSTPTTSASLGNGSTVKAAGDVSVQATGAGRLNAAGASNGGGLVIVGVANVTGTYAPTVSAIVPATAAVTAGRDLLVGATLVVGPGGPSSVTASGGTGGGIVVTQPTAIAYVTPAVTAAVDSAAASAGRDVSVTANSTTNTTATATNDSGGGLTVGNTEADVRTTDANTLARFGPGAVVTAGRNLTLAATANHTVGVTSQATGKAGLAFVHSFTTALLGADTRVVFGDSSTITAAGLLSGTTDVSVTGHSDSTADGSGLGVQAYADKDNDDGGIAIYSNSNVDVRPNANLAGDAVVLRENAGSATAQANATALSAGLGVDVVANAAATVDMSGSVTLFTGGPAGASRRTSVTGTHGVDLLATAGTLAVNRNPFTRRGGIGTATDLTPGATIYNSTVRGRAGVIVTAGARNTANTPLTTTTPSGAPLQLGLYVSAHNFDIWQADVHLLAGPAPTLVVDAAGRIVTAQGLSAAISNGLVTVSDIVNPGPAQAYFDAGDGVATTGSGGLFTFDQSYAAINISVAKGRLQLGSIRPYAATYVNPQVTINAPFNGLEFDAVTTFGSTAINIADTDPNPGQFGIRLSGVIDNPIGTTTLSSVASIYAANFANRDGVVRTNRLVVNTGGDFGNTAAGTFDRVPVDLVESAGRPASVSVNAGGGVYVGLQALNRNPAVTTPNFQTTVTGAADDRFVAGRTADILLLGGVDQTTPAAGSPYGIQVLETAVVKTPAQAPSPPTSPSTTPRTTLVTDHYRLSTTAGVGAAPAGVFGSGSNPIPVTYNLGLVQAGVSINLFKAAAVTSVVNLFSGTDLVDGPNARNVNAGTNGFVRLVERNGDLRVGAIQSTNNTVQVESVQGSILDVPTDNASAATGDATADVIGVNVTLYALHGTIGTAGNVLEIDSGNPRDGIVNVTAGGDIFLYELATLASDFGNLNVGNITSLAGNVSLRAQYGGILDAANDAAADVVGNTITLRTDSGDPELNAVGTPSNDLEIDSSYSAPGGLVVVSDGRVGITETANELYVLGINSADGDSLPTVFLTTRDAPTDRNDVDVTGTVNVAGLTVSAGDDFTQNPDAPINAQGGVTIGVDPAVGDADPFGGTLTVGGTVTARTLALAGGNQIDTFDVRAQTLSGTGTPFTVNGNPPSYPTFPGDTLLVRGNGSVPVNVVTNVRTGTGTVAVPGYTTVNYTNIEQVDRASIDDPPVNILPADFTTDQNPVVLSGGTGNPIQVLDPDTGDAPYFQVTLTPSIGTLTLAAAANVAVTGAGTPASPLRLTGTLADINRALDAGLRLALPANYNGPATITVFSNDNAGDGGPLTDTDVLTINAVNSANDPPVNHLPAPIVTTTTPVVLRAVDGTAISVTDVDAGNAANFLVTLTAADGTLSLTDGSGVAVAGSGTAASPLTLVGTLANINKALGTGLVLTPPAGFTGDTSITIVSNDRGNSTATGVGTPMTDTDTLPITIQQFNQPPVNALPGNVTTDAATPVTFASATGNAISVADPDAGSANNFSVTITVTSGTLSLTAPVATLASVLGGSTPSLVLTGTRADINTSLSNGLVYTPDAGAAGAVTLTVVSNDAGNTGLPGPLTDTDSLTITVNAVTNKPPVNALPPDVVTTATTIILSAANGNAIRVTDPDVDPTATDYKVTLTPAAGLLSFTDLTGVGLGSAAGPFSPPSYTLTGSLAAINAVLASGVTLSLPDGTGTTTLTVVSNDAGHSGAGGPLTDTDVLNVTVVAAGTVNQPPVNALPPDVTTAAASVTFSGDNGTALSVTDPDAGNAADFTATLTPSVGALTLVPTVAAAVAGGGTAASPLVLTGTFANINAALSGGLTLTPPAGFNGIATITMLSNDAGHSGLGGIKTDSDVLRVAFVPGSTPNQPPANRLPAPFTTDLTPITLSAANGTAVSVTDPDAGNATDFSVTLTVSAGTLVLGTTANIGVAGNGSANTPLVLTGAFGDINADLRQGLRIVTPAGFTGPVTLTVTSNDAGHSGTGGAMTDTDSTTITVVSAATPVNDPPVNTLPAPVVTDATSVVFSNNNGNALSVSDVDAGNAANFTVTLTPAVGTLALTAPAVGVAVTGAGTAASPLVLTGPFATINGVLGTGLRFTPPAGFTGPTSILMVSNDAGNTGSGGAKTDADELPVTFVADVNDPPVNHLPAPVTATAVVPTVGNPSTIVTLSTGNGNALSVTDVDAGNATNLTVSLSFGDGTVSLADGSGVTVAGAGTAASPLVLTGSLLTLNAALSRGVRLTFNPGFVGTTLLKMVSNDAGNTGSGGPKADTDYLPVTIAATPSTNPPPRVVAVYADSAAWSATFRDYVDGGSGDGSALGYRVPNGKLQQESLPWVNVNRLRLRFSADVGASLNLSDFALSAAAGYTALGGANGGMPQLLSFAYDPTTFTVTLSFDRAFSTAAVDLKIAAAGVTDAAGRALDGEYTNGVTAGPSGNGTAGGDFSYRLFFVPGDASDTTAGGGTRTVNATDAQRVRTAQNGTLSAAGQVQGAYDARADLNGDGKVDGNDSDYSRTLQNAALLALATTKP